MSFRLQKVLHKKGPNSDKVTAGTRMLSIPNAHLQPAPFRIAVEMGPPSQAVMIFGDEQIACIRPLCSSDVLSATKTLREYPIPLMPYTSVSADVRS